MSDLQSLSMVICGMALLASVVAATKGGHFGPLVRATDPISFWGFLGLLGSLALFGVLAAVTYRLGLWS